MKTLALIAHDERKDAMIEWAQRHRATLQNFAVVATGTTGGRLANEVGLNVEKVLSGPRGGDLQIGALVVTGQISAVIFLRDPLTAHPHEPDISALLKACDIYNVPLATNEATADFIMTSFSLNESSD